MRARVLFGSIAAGAALLVASPAGSAVAPAPVALQQVADGFTAPVYVIGDPARPERLLVVEKGGTIRLLVDGRVRPQPFLDLRGRVATGNEQGLLSLAFDPRWPKRRHVFVNYTDRSGRTIVSRHRVRNGGSQAARRGEGILEIAQPFRNHNGGQLQFGPDGYLYVGMGDGGSAGDPLRAAQDPTTLLGKMLRIDVADLPYSVPADNPDLPGVGRTAIWALGLRNPWRFSFDRATGDLYIGDVGQRTREEIDLWPAGAPGIANFGWNAREGSLPYDPATVPATLPLTDPIHEYGRVKGAAVTGGYVYRGSAIPELVGHYLFGDFVSGRVWSLRVRDGSARRLRELTAAFQGPNGNLAISSFGEDAAGELYVCDYRSGVLYRIVAAQ